jgi:hypothetical protein
MTLGNGKSLKEGEAPEAKNNRCIESSHRHGGVREVGMLRNVIATISEILIDAKRAERESEANKATRIASCFSTARVRWSVRKSEGHVVVLIGFVMKQGARAPYLVDVNREGKDM